MSLLACLCLNNLLGCAPCQRAANDARVRFAVDFPQATPGQLLERAIAAGRADVVLGLLADPSLDVNQRCDPARADSVSPLMTALRACDARIVSLVAAARGFDLGASLSPYARWEWARTCSPPVVQQFLAIPGSDVNLQDGNGETLLHQAVRAARAGVVRDLLGQPGIDVDRQDGAGLTPLYAAVLAGNQEAVTLLLGHPVDVNARNRTIHWTMLMAAVAADRVPIVRQLLQRAELAANAADDSGKTALHVAAERGHAEMIGLLLSRPDLMINQQDQRGATPLAAAAAAGRVEVVQRLLARADLAINRVDHDRQSPLWWATAGRHDAVVRALLHDPRLNVLITNRPARQSAGAVAAETGQPELAALIEAHPSRHRDADVLDPGDPYVERAWAPPPIEWIDPPVRR